MKAKHEQLRGDRLFYCFVDFLSSHETRPLVYVVPSAVVADVIMAAHRKWLSRPGRKGQPHKDGPMRRLLPDYVQTYGPIDNPYPDGWLEPYRDAWHLLQLNPDAPATIAAQ